MSQVGTAATDVVGVDPAGADRVVLLDGPAARIALLFLTGSCVPCQRFWASPPPALGAGSGAIHIVTPDPSTDDRRRVARLAAQTSVPVVMSSQAWVAYGVSQACRLIVVDHGTVVANTQAPDSWAEVAAWCGRLWA